ncbi:MAG: toxin-antitoxin system TumE family protein [bacterium]
MKAKLIKHIKIKEDSGNIIEIKLWQVPVSADKPHGYKYSLVYIVKGERVIGYDNAEGKGDHKHNGDSTEYYEFKTIRRLIDDFVKDINTYKNQKKR